MKPEERSGPVTSVAGPDLLTDEAAAESALDAPSLGDAADPDAGGAAASAASHRNRVGWALALFATVAFSVAPPLASTAIDAGLNPTLILFIRMWLTSALLVATVAVMDMRLMWPGTRCASISLLAGLVNSVGMMGYFWSLTRLDVSVASMIFSVSPLFVLSILAIRGEPVTRRHLLRLLLAIMGVWLLIGPGGSVDLIGVLLVGLAVISFGAQILFIQFYLRDYDARAVTLYMTLGMALGISVFWLLQGAPLAMPNRTAWIAIVALVVVSTYLSRLSMFGAIARIGGAQMALLGPLEIMLTVVWSMLFLGERLLPLQLVGGLFVLASSLLAIERLGRVRVPVRWRLWPSQ